VITHPHAIHVLKKLKGSNNIQTESTQIQTSRKSVFGMFVETCLGHSKKALQLNTKNGPCKRARAGKSSTTNRA
jgi:hypothetical protein